MLTLVIVIVHTDLSPSLFKQLGSLDTGVLKVSWHYMAKDWKP